MDGRLNLSVDDGLIAPHTIRPAWSPRARRILAGKQRGMARCIRVSQSVLLMVLLWAGAAAHALNPDRKLGEYGLQIWQTDSGLPQNSVRAVLQTRDGYMWFATREGLARFDGVSFTVYNRRNTPQFLSNDIRSLLQDRSGNLWISTADGLTRLYRSRFTVFTTAQGLPDNSIWSVFQDSAGGIWAITAGGLAHFTHGHFLPYTTKQGLSSDTVNALSDGPDGSLWVATDSGLNQIREGRVARVQLGAAGNETLHALANGPSGSLWLGTQNGLQRLSGGKLRTYSVADGLPDTEVDVLLADRSGNIWIGTPSGLAVIANGRLKTYTVKDGLPADQIQTLYQDREGTLWVGTNHGIARIIHGTVSAFSPKRGLSQNLVLAIYEDREGSLWVGTESGGVAILRDQKFSALTTADGLSADVVSSVLQGPRGHIWIGTNGGGLDGYDGNRVSVFTEKQGLASDVVLALAAGAEGNLWVGTPDGLNQMRNGVFTSPVSADQLPDEFVRSLLTDSDGSLWVGTRHGLAHIQGAGSRNGRSTIYTQADGLASDFVGALMESGDNSIWIGTLHGLSHLQHGRFRNYFKKNGLSSNVITALYQDRQGNVWIGTNGEGLDVLRKSYTGDRIHSFSANSGLPDVIDGILEDGTGHLWISSNTGIFRVRRSDLIALASGQSRSLAITSYGTADGMKIRECSGIGHPSSWKTSSGTMWFSTLKGVVWINPARLQRNAVPPLVAIEQVSIGGKNVALGRPVVVEPGQSRFSFRYAGLSFVAPQKVRFKYRLNGFDRSWIDAGTRRVAYYTNIPPGKYRFQVLAANNDGVWSTTSASFAFRLEPFFYQTYWFDLLCAMLVLFAGWLVYRWRVQQVESRFNAVLGERARIAREIHDTLAQGFVGISVQLELISQMLTTSPQSVREQLNQTRNLVRDSLAEARRSIWNLRSSETGAVDFASRFSAAINARTAGTSVETNIQFIGTYRPLPEEIQAELLKIALEAVANVLQHAQAAHMEIQMQYHRKRVQMRIQDDGAGFTPDMAPSNREGHFGLVGMRERAEVIGGTFTVDSAPGSGVRICVEVPLE